MTNDSNPSNQPNTDALLALWGNGSADVQQALVVRHQGWIRRRVFSQLGPGLARFADDIVQDCIVEALRYVPRYAPETPSAWKALLSRIVLNEIRMRHRRLKGRAEGRGAEERLRTTVASELGASETEWDPVDRAARNELGERLSDALRLLSARDQEILLLHCEGLSDREIAGRIGLRTDQHNTVRMRRSRAIQRLTSMKQDIESGVVLRRFETEGGGEPDASG